MRTCSAVSNCGSCGAGGPAGRSACSLYGMQQLPSAPIPACVSLPVASGQATALAPRVSALICWLPLRLLCTGQGRAGAHAEGGWRALKMRPPQLLRLERERLARPPRTHSELLLLGQAYLSKASCLPDSVAALPSRCTAYI